ncbi:MAG: hypothetical protein FD149_1596 [Rhodospirillaceae bacterium]|nr:MAG: hypothetical protein FD149_1596 [Rhodospirillaceae bacterium]
MRADGKERTVQAQAMAANMPPLLIAAERVAATFMSGLHGRRQAGPGEIFWQFRRYRSGDPVRGIDWRRSARSDLLYVREREWQAAQSVFLWCDGSPSMAYRAQDTRPAKGERTALVGLALAVLLARAGERVILLGTRGEPPATLPGLAAHLARGGLADLPLEAQALARHGQAVLIGDFLDDLATIQKTVRNIAEKGVTGHLLQVLDPAEETLPFTGRVRFVGLENEGTVEVRRAEDLRHAYGQRLAEHRAGVTALTHAFGWTFAVHHTDAPAIEALVSLFTALSRRG